MDHHHHRHRHQWHPRHPIPGNLCPICSIPHFPFCPPHVNPSYPIDHHPRPKFSPNFAPNFTHQMSTIPAPYPHPGDERYWDKTPSFGYNGNVGMGSEIDRSSKRLRLDGNQYAGGYSSGGGGGGDGKFDVTEENERRLRLIRDHGSSLGGPYNGGVDSGYDSGSGVGRHGRVEHQSGFGAHYGEDPSFVQFVGKSHGYQHKMSGGSEYARDFTPRGHEFDNLSEFHQRSNVAVGNGSFVTDQSRNNAVQYHGRSDFNQNNEVRQVEAGSFPLDRHHGAAVHQNFSVESQYGPSATGKQGAYGHEQASQGLDALPPLPFCSPPPIPSVPAGHWPAEFKTSSPSLRMQSSAIGVASSATPHTLRPCGSQVYPPSLPYFSNSQPMNGSGSFAQGSNIQTSSGKYFGVSLTPESDSSDKLNIVNASRLFKPPDRASRPDHFVIILRGLPGSGKSYLAKMLRDLEVEHGGSAPRIHSMDDYFMTEVEKVDENSASKSSTKGRKPATKTVLEYCYEPEMLEAYRSSMLKAFKKTLDEGAFALVIVDDRNLRVADFAQFWATAKRLGYEVYVLEAPYKDPAGCAARNVHGFSLEEIETMAAQWEEAPPLYLRLEVKSLFHGDDLKDNDIQEVDMDMEDSDDEGLPILEETKPEDALASPADNVNQNGSPQQEQKWIAEGDDSQQEVKDLGHSKWLSDLDDVDAERTDVMKGKSNALSGLLQTYAKEGKSVNWGDKDIDAGFSIGALKKANMAALIIGPGAGYNLKSNPLSEEDATPSTKRSGDTKQHHIFEERLRAERQSFKTVFDRRRQRIGGFDADDE